MNQPSQGFEVFKPNGYTFDVLSKPYTDSLTSTSGHMVLSHYGFYKGNLNENKIKHGRGSFLFSNSIYTGQWNLDKKEGDGTLVILKPTVTINKKKKSKTPQPQKINNKTNTNTTQAPAPAPAPTTPKKVSPNLSPRFQPLSSSPSPTPTPTSTSTSTPSIGITISNEKLLLNKISNKFNEFEELIKQQSNSEFLKQQDYFRGKWINGKANGIGSFHFSKDDSTHYDFWRQGVAIRYTHQGNILKPLYEDSLPFGLLNSREILKEMLDDWKKVIGNDDDFPSARPYLTTPTSSISIPQQQQQQTNSNSTCTSPPTTPHSKITPIGIEDIGSGSPIGSVVVGLQHSKTQPNVLHSQTHTPTPLSPTSPLSPTITPIVPTVSVPISTNIDSIILQRNQQKILKQQLMKLTNSVKQSFGIITAQYLKNRIENEEKFFITLILFISKWEIPFKSFNIPNNNNSSTHASFLIFVPDTDNCTFTSLSNLIMQSNILEKLIFKLLIDPISKIDTVVSNGKSSPNNISPSTSLNSVSSISTALPSSTPEERELHKLLPICLDLDETPSIEKECIGTILCFFKLFPVIEDYQPPQFIPDIICNLISCFKKTKSLENYLLFKQFQMSKDYFFKISTTTTTTTTPTTPPPTSTSSTLSTSSPNNSIPSAYKTLRKTKNLTNGLNIKDINSNGGTSVLPSISISAGSGSGGNTTITSPSVKSPVTSPPTFKPLFSGSLTTNKIDISASNPGISTSTSTSTSTIKNTNGTVMTSNSSSSGIRRQTIDGIFPSFKQQSNSDLLSSLMKSTSIVNKIDNQSSSSSQSQNQPPPELTLQSLNILFSQFKQSYQFPESLNKSIQYIQSVYQNIEGMKKIINSKIIVIQEALNKSKKVDNNQLTTSISTSTGGVGTGGTCINDNFKNYLNDHDNLISSILKGLKNDLSQLDTGFEVCLKLYKELSYQQIQLILKRLKLGNGFINQLLNLPSSRISKSLPKDYYLRFIKHIHKIAYQLINYYNSNNSNNSNNIFSLDIQIKNQIDQFISQSSDLFSKLPNQSNNNNNINGIISSPSPTNQSPQLTSISTSVYEYFLSKKSNTTTTTTVTVTTSTNPSSPTLLSTSPTSSNSIIKSLNIGQHSNNFIRSNSLDKTAFQFESSDITPGPFTFISPLDKITEEIMSGHYQLILPVASSGDDLLVSVISNGLIDLRTYLSNDNRLKDMSKSSLIQLFNILLHSTIICNNITLYLPEVFKTLNLLLPYYPKKDELFLKYKEIFIGFLEFSIKDESFNFSQIYLTFLGLLVKPKKKGIRKEMKKEFVEMFPIQLFIDIMGGNGMVHIQDPIIRNNFEKTRAQAAQILINLSISSIDYLIEVKNRNALSMVLDICKFGQAFAHTQIEENELEILEFLGEGALAKVNRGIYKGKEVAIKIFNEGSFSFRLEDFLKEVAILGLVSHPNLLKLKGACIAPRSTKSTFMIVTELMHKGTLLDVIQKNKPLSSNEIIKHALSVAQGLEYLHSIDFIHRDIKAANILVDSNNNAKVADFGMSRVIDARFNMTAVAGTPKWESPECLMGDVYTSASDVYSYGMLLFELSTGEEPFSEIQSIVELVRSVVDKKLKPKIPSSVPSFFTSLIKDCLSNNPKKRPTMTQIIQKLIHESKHLNNSTK